MPPRGFLRGNPLLVRLTSANWGLSAVPGCAADLEGLIMRWLLTPTHTPIQVIQVSTSRVIKIRGTTSRRCSRCPTSVMAACRWCVSDDKRLLTQASCVMVVERPRPQPHSTAGDSDGRIEQGAHKRQMRHAPSSKPHHSVRKPRTKEPQSE